MHRWWITLQIIMCAKTDVWKIFEAQTAQLKHQLEIVAQKRDKRQISRLFQKIIRLLIRVVKYPQFLHSQQEMRNQVQRNVVSIISLIESMQSQLFIPVIDFVKRWLYSSGVINSYKTSQFQQQIMLTKSSNLQINQFFDKVATNEITLNNCGCLKCSKVLIHGLCIQTKDSGLDLVGLTQHEGFDRVSLERALIALSNLQGGIIFIGVERIDNGVRPVGINFTNIREVKLKQKEIQQSIKNIGLNLVQTQIVLVSKLDPIHRLLEQKKLKYCFRIIVPNSDTKKYKYLQINPKGFQSKYEAYIIDSSHRPMKVQAGNKHQPNSIYYEMINKFYRKRRIKNSSHEGISCQLPIQYQYHEILNHLQHLQASPLNELGLPQNQEDIKFDDDPQFMYAYTSLLSVSSLKNERYITDLIPFFEYRKFSVEITKPFQNSFKSGAKPIWMISHKQKFNIIKNAIKEQQKGGNITFMPVFQTLQIQRSKFNEFNQNIFLERFKKRYPNGYQLEWKTSIDVNNSTVFTADLTFQNYTQSIYAYFLFEEIQLRPYFVQENTTFKKKPKKY